MTSHCEAASTLALYEQQREQVTTLLATDPTNAKYLKLANDLDEAIALTRTLLNDGNSGGGGLVLRKAPVASGGKGLGVGDRCEAPYGDKATNYPAIILALGPDGKDATIKYIGYSDEDVKPLEELVPLSGKESLETSTLVSGFECQAKWVGDGRFYDAVVQEATEHGCYRVKFTQYGNEVEVPLEYLRGRGRGVKRGHEGGHGGEGSAAGEEGQGKGKGGSAVFIIPENLKILPTDSEEEKNRKRKKVKHLKGLFNKRKADEEDTEKAKSWQDYLNKSKKSKQGLAKTKKGSIFASPDTVDGKVGVTGSGQGMTNFDPRLRGNKK